MLRFHKEGKKIILITLVTLILIELLLFQFLNINWILILSPAIVLCILILQFFRNPIRKIPVENDSLIYAPADGKVVVIEDVQPDEYLDQKSIQISIFMSPLNVHVNRYPTRGKIEYVKYYPGKYLPAWDPKSSYENERSAIGINNKGQKLLIKQIAGAVARRIVYYSEVGQQVNQGADLGFIKFGSRVDILLPFGTEILVNLEEKVKGNQTVLAKLKPR